MIYTHKMKKLLLILTVFSATLVTAQNVPSYVPTNGLVGWWPFNGNANDESGNGNHGTVFGATLTSDRNGNSNTAYDFDGADDYINLGQLDSLSNSPDSYTQLAWLKFADLSDRRVIGTKRNGSGGWATPYATDTALLFYVNDAGYTNANIGYTTTIDDSNYFFVCFVKDTSYYSIYVNGALVDTMFDSYSIPSNSSPYYIGHHSLWNKYMKGTIDCFGLWNRALNSNEIMQFYNGNGCTYIDTTYINVFDTIAVFDTIQVFDTTAVFDTNYVDVFDTTYIDVHDTIFVTQIDTVYLTVADTLIIDVSLIGINPPTFEYQVLVYPNPTNNYLYVDVPQSMISQSYSMEIKNSIGQSVFGIAMNQPQIQINFNSFGAAGAFTLSIKDSGGNVVDTRVIILQ
jgi:hypothetical protein